MGSSSSTSIHISYENGRLYKETKVDDNNPRYDSIPATEIDHINLTNEEWDDIKKKGSKEFDYCLTSNDLNGINECASLFDNPGSYVSKLDQFRIVKGRQCYTLAFRPGIFIEPVYKSALDEFSIESIEGNACQIIYQDYNYTDEDLKRCCYEGKSDKCNANLINDYTSSHCNVTMVENCKNDMNNPNCIRWLEQSINRFNNEALELYSNWCSKNFDSPTCDYLCAVARSNKDYRSQFCDRALKIWCQNNKSNTKCFCLNTPNTLIPNVETFLGPKECWLSNCSGEPNNKWLTTEQIETRQNCLLTSCVIDINTLTLNDNSSAKLINDCVSGTKVSSADYYKLNKNVDYKIKNTPGVLFNLELFILSISMILLTFK